MVKTLSPAWGAGIPQRQDGRFILPMAVPANCPSDFSSARAHLIPGGLLWKAVRAFQLQPGDIRACTTGFTKQPKFFDRGSGAQWQPEPILYLYAARARAGIPI